MAAQRALKMSKDKDKDLLRWAANSYPPAYPGCHGLRSQILGRDTLTSVALVAPNYTLFCGLPRLTSRRGRHT